MRQQHPKAPLLLANAEAEPSYQPQRCMELRLCWKHDDRSDRLSCCRFWNEYCHHEKTKAPTHCAAKLSAGRPEWSLLLANVHEHNPQNGTHSGLLLISSGSWHLGWLLPSGPASGLTAFLFDWSQTHHHGSVWGRVSRPASQHRRYSLSIFFLVTSSQSNLVITQLLWV